MATQSSILAWRIPWTEQPGRLQSMGSQRIGHDWATNTHTHTHTPTHTQRLGLYFSRRDLRQWSGSNSGEKHLIQFAVSREVLDILQSFLFLASLQQKWNYILPSDRKVQDGDGLRYWGDSFAWLFGRSLKRGFYSQPHILSFQRGSR